MTTKSLMGTKGMAGRARVSGGRGLSATLPLRMMKMQCIEAGAKMTYDLNQERSFEGSEEVASSSDCLQGSV